MSIVSPGDIRQGCKVSATTHYNGHLVYWLEGDQSTAFYAENDEIAQCSLGDKLLRIWAICSKISKLQVPPSSK